MSPLILSACLLSGLTRPLSPAEVRARPEPGSLAFGLYAVRAACSVRKGMTLKEVEAILGQSVLFGRIAGRGYDWYLNRGILVVSHLRNEAIGGIPETIYRVEEVRLFSLEVWLYSHQTIRPRPAR